MSQISQLDQCFPKQWIQRSIQANQVCSVSEKKRKGCALAGTFLENLSTQTPLQTLQGEIPPVRYIQWKQTNRNSSSCHLLQSWGGIILSSRVQVIPLKHRHPPTSAEKSLFSSKGFAGYRRSSSLEVSQTTQFKSYHWWLQGQNGSRAQAQIPPSVQLADLDPLLLRKQQTEYFL